MVIASGGGGGRGWYDRNRGCDSRCLMLGAWGLGSVVLVRLELLSEPA